MSEDVMQSVDLLDDPFADDLDAQLQAKAPRRYVTRPTIVLCGLLLVAGGFLAGAQVQKQWGTPATGAPAGVANLAAAGGFGGPRAQQSAAPSTAAVTTGTVKLVDGATVYVETADGTVVTVRTTDRTAVQLAQSGALKDLTPGTKVTVEGGPAGADVVNATKLTRPAG
jgi:hypothetical protein